MKDYTLEVCVDSVESAIAAVRGGASRLELCGNLVIGGTTPSPYLFQEIRKFTDIRIHVLIRPRFGDFCYVASEYQMMKEEIRAFGELGADGIVIGILKPDGGLDRERMAGLLEQAGGMSVTLHRAFDVCADPYFALEQAIELGIHTILTSGQSCGCRQGAELIGELVRRAAGRIEILAGGGVSAEVIRQIYPVTHTKAYHMSGKVTVDSAMKYRKKGVNMGLPSFSEFEIWRTDETKIREAIQVLEGL